MILYFDNYITDIPNGRPRPLKDDFRSKAKIYAMPSRLAISKYALASYAVYPWSNVLIKYQIDDAKESQEFESYARQLFPKAHIIKNRSNTQAEYKKSLEVLDQMGDEWIFYAPNNDQILLLTERVSVEYINGLLKRAEKYKSQYEYFSVPYSLFTEYINFVRPGSLNYGHLSNGVKILEEDSEAVVALMPIGDFNSVRILNNKLFRQFFTSANLGDKRVIRLEDLVGSVKIENEVEIVPKIELGVHFEGYEHMLGSKFEIRIDQIPSPFLPTGFFENNIKIAYGYNTYRPGWVNINPAAKKYSFRDPVYGTDLKIGLNDIPLFWKSRISELDINKDADSVDLEKGRLRQLEIVNNPWSFKNRGLNLSTVRYWLKRPLIRFYPMLNNLGIMPILKKAAKLLGFY